MRALIAGGRDYAPTLDDWTWLTDLHLGDHITEVVSGGASGADAFGEQWAKEHSVPVKRFPADWKAHGRAAGPIRNRLMAEYVKQHGGVVILFPGGRGTASMKSIALELGLTVKEPWL